jgi:hypothetical protein
MTHKELVAKAKVYLASLDDSLKDEAYTTARGFAVHEVAGFLDFLGVKQNLLEEVEREEN